ncbi:MAG: glycoside hydrolase family 3 N-terminal domain-containing protein [Muribaculaceae bacterium]|nr:glycoside hydrolase family 3 N-terminal domain-containing protein [Muribaculaceae bacterium]
MLSKCNYIISLLLFVVFSIELGEAKEPTLYRNVDKSKMNQWVDFTFNALTPRERIAQLMMPVLFPNESETTAGDLVQYLKVEKVGGLLVSKGTIENYVEYVNKAQSMSSTPLLISIDGEYGLAMRLKEAIPFPRNMILGAITDDRLLYEYGRAVARQCEMIGINIDFAPVLDVNTNPNNPVIGYRSFGELPEMVGRKGVAYSKGLEDGGVLSVAKHFPGHGSTDQDSHKTLPTVNKSKGEIQTVDLVPFKKYINSGLGGVLVGHLNLPAFDKSGIASSLNPNIVERLLVRKLNFDGLIFTDALGMKGAKSEKSPSVMALLAGNDVLLCPSNVTQEINAIEKSIETGELTLEDINKKCKKVLSYKYILGLNKPKVYDSNNITNRINDASTKAIINKLWEASMTVFINNNNILPIGSVEKGKIGLYPTEKVDKFVNTCKLYSKIEILDANNLSTTDAEYIIVPITGDNTNSQNVLSQAVSTGKKVIAVFMMSPYKVPGFRASLKADNLSAVMAFENCDMAQLYAAQVVFGGISAKGKMPVSILGVVKAGAGNTYKATRLGFCEPEEVGVNSRLLNFVDSIAQLGVNSNAFPGCQVLMAKDGKIICNKNFGLTDATLNVPVDDFTLYDLASVSKASGTLSGIMKAYDEGLIDLNARISQYIPELATTDKKDITVKELLFHVSGIQPSLNMFDIMFDKKSYAEPLFKKKQDRNHTILVQGSTYGNKNARIRTDIVSKKRSKKFDIELCKGVFGGQVTYDTIMNRIYNSKLRPTKNYAYSCLNFSLLMKIEQNCTGTPHNIYVENNIFNLLGAYHSVYRPLDYFPLAMIAPTEDDNFLRDQKLQGFVHDELACFSGGIQGNAGFFSNANDLAKLCQMWLNNGVYGGKRILSEKTVKLFTTTSSNTCRRGLGFDKPDKKNEDNSPTCESATAETYGHLGFTGTCFWVDPVNNMFFVFLCNRVNPTRNNEAFNELDIRPKLFQALYDNLIK